MAVLDHMAFVREDFSPNSDYWQLVTHCRSGNDHARAGAPGTGYYDVVYGPVSLFPQFLVIADADQISFHTEHALTVLTTRRSSRTESPCTDWRKVTMGVARKVEDVDTHAYWSDVTDALKEVCQLSADEAAEAVSNSRQAMTGLSDWGRLLAYHDSVPQAAEDLWKQGPGADAGKGKVKAVRQELISWYTERNRERGFLRGAVGSSAQEQTC